MTYPSPIISVPELAGIRSLQWFSAEQSGSELTTTTVLRGKAAKQDLFNNEIFDSLRESEIGEYGFYAGHEVKYGFGKFDEIVITAVQLVVPTKNEYYSKFEVTSRTESRPFEEKKESYISGDDTTYLMWWNHEIRAAKGAAELSEAQKTTLRTLTSKEGGTGIDGYYWARTNQATKESEDVFMDAAFPGVQTYGVPFDQVKEIIYTRSEDKIRDMCKQVGRHKFPERSDGTSYDSSRDTDAEWLITSASYRKNLGWFEGTRTYAYAPGGWLRNNSVTPIVKVYPTSDEAAQ